MRGAVLRAPDNIPLIGVDGHPLSSIVDLTTIGQDVLTQARLAAHLVIKAPTGDAPVTPTGEDGCVNESGPHSDCEGRSVL